MHVIYLAVTILAALANGYAAGMNFAGAESVKLHGRVFSVMAFTVTNDKIARIDALLDPERLDRLDLRV